jgi:hypothetical protein
MYLRTVFKNGIFRLRRRPRILLTDMATVALAARGDFRTFGTLEAA